MAWKSFLYFWHSFDNCIFINTLYYYLVCIFIMFPKQVDSPSSDSSSPTRPCIPSMPTPDQSPRGSLPHDAQDPSAGKYNKGNTMNLVSNVWFRLEKIRPGTPIEGKSTLPSDFFAHSSPPLPISPLSSFRAQDSPTPESRQHRRSISMDRDIRKKLQQMKMTSTDEPQTIATSKAKRANSMHKPLGRHKLSLNNFILEKTVGTGSFGRVHLAQGRTTGRFYAIKALRKQELVDRRQVEHANNERVILRSVDHPFVVKLWDTFQDEGHVFFVMDYVPGGELFRILRKNKVKKKDKR